MNRQHKTIIIFSPAFAADETDTTWLPWLQIFTRSLNKIFPELKVVIFAFQYPYTTKVYQWHNNKVIPFNGFYKKKSGRIFMWLKILSSARKIKKQYDVTGILSLWCGECAFVARYASAIFKLTHFCWVLGQDARTENPYAPRIRPKATSLIAMSDFLADEFHKNHGIRPRHIVPNGIDTSLFTTGKVEKDVDMIGIGSLSTLKRYDVFVRIVEALKKNIPHIRAVLVGDGEEQKRIETMIEELSLQENIILTGAVQYDKGLQMMQSAKILLHPSSYEGFSSVCLEALYAGAHVISFVQPMHFGIKNWHIVTTDEEMQAKALELLSDTTTVYEPVFVYRMDDSARSIIKLFGYDP